VAYGKIRSIEWPDGIHSEIKRVPPESSGPGSLFEKRAERILQPSVDAT